jgi:hypothetical protein
MELLVGRALDRPSRRRPRGESKLAPSDKDGASADLDPLKLFGAPGTRGALTVARSRGEHAAHRHDPLPDLAAHRRTREAWSDKRRSIGRYMRGSKIAC